MFKVANVFDADSFAIAEEGDVPARLVAASGHLLRLELDSATPRLPNGWRVLRCPDHRLTVGEILSAPPPEKKTE